MKTLKSLAPILLSIYVGLAFSAPPKSEEKLPKKSQSAGSTAENKSAEQGMVIRGDQEAPLVLYIVPWQESSQESSPQESPISQTLQIMTATPNGAVETRQVPVSDTSNAPPVFPVLIGAEEGGLVDDPAFLSLDPASNGR